MKSIGFLSKRSLLFFAAVLLFTGFAFSQTLETDKEYSQAMEFVRQNRRIDALPLFEKLAIKYPKDAEIQANLAISILANSVVLKDEKSRNLEVDRGTEILRKAKKLGTENILALHYLEKIDEGLDIGIGFDASSKEVEDALREGEGFFGKGEYEKAFQAYQKAYKLDPKNYDSALFSGDCFYAQSKFAESEIWFSKATVINPNREQAFRFWGDALANQNKGREALEKYANAYIAEPNSQLVFNSWIEGVKKFGFRRTSPFVMIPVDKNVEEITIDTAKLSPEDGSLAWNTFTQIRKKQIDVFTKVANGREFVSTVSEDVECFKGVVQAAKANLQKDKSLQLNKNLENLIKLDALDMLDIYTILFFHGGDNSKGYKAFREKHRERMIRFLIDYFADDTKLETKNFA
jgi:tetratricopeptide (TPR) repeat protein